jgi:hypothetical protein
MLGTMWQALVAPKQPRFYTGRHRATNPLRLLMNRRRDPEPTS